jgi:hypothetical protein
MRKPVNAAGGFIQKSYEGPHGKAFLAGDIAMIASKIPEIINPEDTAKLVFDANPGMFASLEDAKRQVGDYNWGQIGGAIVDNFTNILVSRGVASIGSRAVVPLITRGAALIGAEALGASAIGALGGPVGIAATVLATIGIMALLEVFNPESSTRGSQETRIMKQGGTVEGIDIPVLGNPTYGTSAADAVSYGVTSFMKNLQDGMTREPNQNSRNEVETMRTERKPMKYEWVGEDGNVYQRTYYSNFGNRTQEVRALLTSGYFIYPTGNMMDVPDGKGGYKQIREFSMDYDGFIRWLEDSDWVANPTGIRQRVVSLPRIAPLTVTAAQKEQISVEEAAYALKSWYDDAGFTIK